LVVCFSFFLFLTFRSGLGCVFFFFFFSQSFVDVGGQLGCRFFFLLGAGAKGLFSPFFFPFFFPVRGQTLYAILPFLLFFLGERGRGPLFPCFPSSLFIDEEVAFLPSFLQIPVVVGLYFFPFPLPPLRKRTSASSPLSWTRGKESAPPSPPPPWHLSKKRWPR